MEEKDRRNLLMMSNNGIDIYAHVLRKYYPDMALRVSGYVCDVCRNPFDGGSLSLEIGIVCRGDGELIGCHVDRSGVIGDGDVFDFAGLHYGCEGWDLYRKIFLDMRGELKVCPEYLRFSFFVHPVTNVVPLKTIGVMDVYRYISGDYAKERTLELRKIKDRKAAQDFKRRYFDFCTFAGVFRRRGKKGLVSRSALMCFDFDHVGDVEQLRGWLIHDRRFFTHLVFRSPSGDGLKWVIEYELEKWSYEKAFRAVKNYIAYNYRDYGICVDGSGSDVGRACYLPYDPDVYMNDSLLEVTDGLFNF